MIVYRIDKPRRSDRDAVLSGEGARRSGGRWNRSGLPVVYASENRSLAILEKLVQVQIDDLPASLVILSIEVPDRAHATHVRKEKLPRDWRRPRDAACLELGSDWIERKIGLVLRVPSAVNPCEENVLLNPLHPDIAHCYISASDPLDLDQRLSSRAK